MSRWRYVKRGGALVAVGVTGFGAYAGYNVLRLRQAADAGFVVRADDCGCGLGPRLEKFPTRAAQLRRLTEEEFDVVVIGGGATGAGVALDAQTRGLKTALIERNDFASGTSSRSTKLIHGGVRYLQKAVMGLDKGQYDMVKEALQERANLISIAPHLAYPLPIMLPVYSWWKIPYYWAGIKAYDLVAGGQLLKWSYFLGKDKALDKFPMLKRECLSGALVYFDGQHDDARMCLTIALTAARFGSTIANHTEVERLIKKKGGCVAGVECRDNLTGETFKIRAKSVINATGPFTDGIRIMDNPKAKPICQPSAGVHIVLPDYYSPSEMGLIDPNTSDGRVIFFLPWMNYTIAGTTDSPCPVTAEPEPTEQDVEFILNEIKKYLNQDITVRRGDVTSCWSGIRPLVSDPNKADTQSLARNHIIHVSDSNLVTIAGGKWTTYRAMAMEAVDAAIKYVPDLQPEYMQSQTLGLMLEGAEKWTPTMHIRLVQDFGMDTFVAEHLASTYGDKAFNVAKLAGVTGKRWPVHGIRLHEEFPYLEGEVRYACKAEYAQTAVDVIARRTRLSFLNVNAAKEALPRILDIMQEELKWPPERRKKEEELADKFLRVQMGIDLKKSSEKAPIQFTAEEINALSERFRGLDTNNKGYIVAKDLVNHMKGIGQKVTEEQMHTILDDVDINRNGQIELGEFLHFMSSFKHGRVSSSAFAVAAGLDVKAKNKFDPDRSGGGI